MTLAVNETDLAALAAGAARVVYAVRLNLGGSLGPEKNYRAARGLTREWIAGRYGGWPDDVDKANGVWQPRPDHTVSVRTWHAADDASAFVATREIPHDDNDMLVHRTVVSVVLDGDNASITVQQAIAAAPGVDTFGGTVEFSLARPHIVPVLLNKLIVVDSGRRLGPGRYKTNDDYEVATLIRNPNRALPVVVCNPGPSGPPPCVDAIADKAGGLAHVVLLETNNTARDLAYRLGPGAGVSPGAVRIYWPGFTHTGESYTWYADQQTGDRHGSFADMFARRLYTLSAFWVQPPAAIETIRVRERRQRTAAVAAAARAAGSAQLSDDFMAEYDRDLDRLAQAERDLAHVRALLAQAEADKEMLNQALTEAAMARRGPRINSAGVEEEDPEFRDVADAVRYAADTLTHLRFHPNAFESAAQSAYRFPQQVYDDLATLNAVAAEWKETGRIAAGGWYPALKDLGVPFAANVSDTARTLHAGDYTITDDDGTKLLLGPHIARGNATAAGHFRIYMHFNDDTRVVTVGHVGRHLRGARDT